ncbi:MAG: hypothetical protein EOQ93_02920 [Mesorhizobium sp.]|nr:MAG: hypothetical protein EOQ93_02920 [Mesorhizobium sp.]
MARYFFHLFENGECTKDDTGMEMDTDDHVRQEAMRVLPEIAIETVSRDGDHQAFTVLATDETGRPVYTATLTFAGLWLNLSE